MEFFNMHSMEMHSIQFIEREKSFIWNLFTKNLPTGFVYIFILVFFLRFCCCFCCCKKWRAPRIICEIYTEVREPHALKIELNCKHCCLICNKHIICKIFDDLILMNYLSTIIESLLQTQREREKYWQLAIKLTTEWQHKQTNETIVTEYQFQRPLRSDRPLLERRKHEPIKYE